MNQPTTWTDFLEWSLVIKLNRIDESVRRKDEDIKKEFERLYR